MKFQVEKWTIFVTGIWLEKPQNGDRGADETRRRNIQGKIILEFIKRVSAMFAAKIVTYFVINNKV